MGISKEDVDKLHEKLDKVLIVQAETRQYLVDQRPRCDSHAKDISNLEIIVIGDKDHEGLKNKVTNHGRWFSYFWKIPAAGAVVSTISGIIYKVVHIWHKG